MHKDLKIIAFDLDGVLYDGPSAAFHLAQQVGIGHKYQELFMRMVKENLSFDDSLRLGAEIWKGIEFGGEYRQLVMDMPLMEGAEETLDVLKTTGYQVGCISSGVSQFFMEPFTKRLSLNFAHSNILPFHRVSVFYSLKDRLVHRRNKGIFLPFAFPPFDPSG